MYFELRKTAICKKENWYLLEGKCRLFFFFFLLPASQNDSNIAISNCGMDSSLKNKSMLIGKTTIKSLKHTHFLSLLKKENSDGEVFF